MHLQGFYHGDVKIENVLVQSGGAAGPQARLADFGNAKPVSLDLDGRAADVFALGLVLCVLLNNDDELPAAAKQVMAGSTGYKQLIAFRNGEYPLGEMTDLDQSVWDFLFVMTRMDPTQRASID
ncbi:hypothetical protein HDU98_011069 [Podochytrium sp. JEL0797]|nr:hypothetical protein HDU98_011069 [Podochytrium sp. JEL0797]